MASEIFYCSRCQTRLFGNQFVDGTAFRVRDQVSCENCLGEIIAPLSLEEQQEILLQVKALKDSQVLEELPLAPSEIINQEEFFELDSPEAKTGTDDFFELDTPEKRAARTRKAVPVMSKSQAVEESQNRAVVIFLVCLVGIAALGGFLYYNSTADYPTTSGAERPNFGSYTPTPKTYGSTATDPRAEEVKALLAKASDFARGNPLDLAGQDEAYKKALDLAVGSSWGPDAKREYDGMLQRHKELLAKEFDVLDKETSAAVEKEDFRPAMDRLEQAKSKYNVGEWRGGIDLRSRNLKNSIWKTLFPLRDKAIEAKQHKKDAEVKAVVDRVAKWGLPEFSRELDNALGGGAAASTTTTTAPADVVPASSDLKTYESRWRQAMELAAIRNYDGALAALDKAGADLKEADVKAALAADKEILAKVQALYKEALQVISMWKRNEKIPLESLDENLANVRSEDPFLRADLERVEVARAGAPFPIQFSDLTARSLTHLLRKSKATLSEADAKTAALLCLLEGEVEPARQNFAGPTEQIPYKYWSLATRIAESRTSTSDAAKRELAARRTYFAAEQGYSDVKTRAMAVQNYRELLTLFPGTSIVERHRSQILARRDGAKEYIFLPDDMDGAGTFNKSGKQPKYGECWTSTADSDPSRGAHNYVNVKFYAFPDVTYSCWAYVGACCIETFAAYYQATDLTYTKGNEVLKLDPGSNASLPVRNSITFLKKTHVEHGGPKEARTWQWAELKMPKYTQPGIKDVRLVTDQKGYSVTFIVISASRNSPPNEAEMRSWIKRPEAVAVTEEKPPAPDAGPVVEARDPSLVGLWKLDEAGSTAIDTSGRDNSGVLVNEPSRVPGKNGGAIAFDGKERYVSIPNSEILDRLQEGTFTLAAWFKPNSKPGDPNDAAYAIFAKSPLHEGILYNADQKFVMDHVLANGSVVSAVSATAFPPGAYYHVAGVVSRSEGSVRIYVNGKQEGSGSYAAAGAAKDFKNETWKIGIAAPSGGALRLSADGIVDDVRVYNRALQSADLKTIAGIAGGNAPSVVFTSPLPGEKFDPNATVTLSATVTPSDRISKVEFYAGSTLLGSRTSAPFTFTWNKVAGGAYTLVARATDRSGAAYTSTPLTIKVGNPTLYRALNLGGGSVRVGDVDYEGKGAKKVSVIGSPVQLNLELTPPPDASIAPLLKGAVVQPLGTSVSLIDIPNGTYQVFLYVCAGANPQVFDLQIAGRIVQSKIQSGPAGTWQKLGPWVVDSSGGLLEIAAKNGEVNFCALEVWRVAR
ncbi:MAG TPA: LamG-like jellyroll fold domain-containing protein [Planctomycetota bacterium]|nr:LamG-like jellyroll fold domain-containing protein [Planctomycetota bacterium]